MSARYFFIVEPFVLNWKQSLRYPVIIINICKVFIVWPMISSNTCDISLCTFCNNFIVYVVFCNRINMPCILIIIEKCARKWIANIIFYLYIRTTNIFIFIAFLVTLRITKLKNAMLLFLVRLDFCSIYLHIVLYSHFMIRI